MKSIRHYLPPKQFLAWAGADDLPPHIKHVPGLTKANGATYEIVRESTHDGTGTFTAELIRKALWPLFYKVSYDNRLPTDNVRDIYYEIGDISRAVVFGRFDLPAGNFEGQRERIRIPVKCRFIYE